MRSRKPSMSRRELNASFRYYAAMAPEGKDVPDLTIPERAKRAVVNHSDASELEGAVMREVAELLGAHSLVQFAVRQNSGGASLTGKNGEVRPIFFYSWVRRRGKRMRITDYWGFLTDGRPFAIECKRRSWTHPNDQRELEQQEFIDSIKSLGGVGGFATSSAMAKEILEGRTR